MATGNVRQKIAITLSLFLLIICGCNGSRHSDDAGVYTLTVNGISVDGTVPAQSTAAGLLVDARIFASRVPGLTYFPMGNKKFSGFTLQYGKRISFAAADYLTGFAAARPITMTPPVRQAGESYWTPLAFLAQAVDGEIKVNKAIQRIDVTLGPPQQLGDSIKEANSIAQQLSAQFDVRLGEILKTDPINFYTAGFAEDCNGNNAGADYLVTQTPPSPRSNSLNVIPTLLQMDQDEAIVWVGYTPPESRYFSYHTYLMNRYLGDVTPPTIKKIYARLGDSINLYNLPLGGANRFRQFFVLIIAANADTYASVRQSVLRAGIAADRIMPLVLPAKTAPDLPVNFGLAMTADSFSFLHRVSIFATDTEQAAYVAKPTIEVLRVTPKVTIASRPLTRPAERSRVSGTAEQGIAGVSTLLTDLRAAIIKRYGGSYRYMKELKTGTWMYPGGDVAIAEREDVLGETNDTLYLKTENFVLQEDDLIVVFGPNHDVTGKTVYSNVACYNAAADNGVGGIVSTPYSPAVPNRRSYFGTAGEFLPGIAPALSDMAYVYKFARQAKDSTTYAIPYNADRSFNGIDNGDTVFMGYRLYVDRATTVGPFPGNVRDSSYFSESGPADSEVFFDQAIVFYNNQN